MISAKRLREAARQTEKTFLVGLPEPEDCKAVFSSKFQRQMKSLVRRTDHPVLYRVVKVTALVLSAVLLAGSSILAFSPTARTALAEWVREGCPLPSVSQEPDGGFANGMPYAPAWLPDGFSEGAQFVADGYTCAVYESAERGYILLAYTENAAAVSVRQDGDSAQAVLVGDLPGELYAGQGGTSSLTWSDPEKGGLFWLYGSCSGEDLIQIAESVTAETQK